MKDTAAILTLAWAVRRGAAWAPPSPPVDFDTESCPLVDEVQSVYEEFLGRLGEEEA